jgi:hypothetical protein
MGITLGLQSRTSPRICFQLEYVLNTGFFTLSYWDGRRYWVALRPREGNEEIAMLRPEEDECNGEMWYVQKVHYEDTRPRHLRRDSRLGHGNGKRSSRSYEEQSNKSDEDDELKDRERYLCVCPSRGVFDCSRAASRICLGTDPTMAISTAKSHIKDDSVRSLSFIGI